MPRVRLRKQGGALSIHHAAELGASGPSYPAQGISVQAKTFLGCSFFQGADLDINLGGDESRLRNELHPRGFNIIAPISQLPVF